MLTTKQHELLIYINQRLASTGVALGIAGAFAVTRLLSSLLFGVTPSDPLTFLVVSALLVFVAVLANTVLISSARHGDNGPC